MATYNAQREEILGNGLQNMQRDSNRKRVLLSGQKPLVILSLFVLALSVVFPYGIGVAVFAWVIALTGALIGVGYASYLLLKELFNKSGSFNYAPTAAYLAGKKTKGKCILPPLAVAS